MMLANLPWVQLITVAALAVLTKEYLSLRRLLQDARLSGICETCPDETPAVEMEGKLERLYQQQQKVSIFFSFFFFL